MKKIVLILMVAFAPGSVLAAGGTGSGIPMEHMEVRLADQNSLQNGAKLFVNYCLSCHSAKYMRYGRLVDDLGIPSELVENNMIFSDSKKIGDTMTTTMPEKKADNNIETSMIQSFMIILFSRVFQIFSGIFS